MDREHNIENPLRFKLMNGSDVPSCIMYYGEEISNPLDDLYNDRLYFGVIESGFCIDCNENIIQKIFISGYDEWNELEEWVNPW